MSKRPTEDRPRPTDAAKRRLRLSRHQQGTKLASAPREEKREEGNRTEPNRDRALERDVAMQGDPMEHEQHACSHACALERDVAMQGEPEGHEQHACDQAPDRAKPTTDRVVVELLALLDGGEAGDGDAMMTTQLPTMM